MATHCAFGDYLSEAIRDCIVCGLRNEHIQKRLLAETDLTLTKTMESHRAWKHAADQNAQKLKGNKLNLRVSEISLELINPVTDVGVNSMEAEHVLTEKQSVGIVKRRAVWLECVRANPEQVTKLLAKLEQTRVEKRAAQAQPKERQIG